MIKRYFRKSAYPSSRAFHVCGRLSAFLVSGCLLALMLSGCSGGDDDNTAGNEDDCVTVSLVISAPKSADGTRVGDPGEDHNEDEGNWDTLTLFFVYTQEGGAELPGSITFVKKILSKEAFEALAPYNGSNDVKELKIDLPIGNVYIYGVTYSSEADNNNVLINGINNLSKATDVKSAVESLEISNSYAAGDTDETSKFLSVATGFYDNDSDGTPDYYKIERGKETAPGDLPVIKLTRLAAKIDIQWDAYDAYVPEGSYSDVKVSSFMFYGDKDIAGSNGTNGSDETAGKDEPGNGRLFPELNVGKDVLGGYKGFYNTSAVSKRNGRVYHYVFPDGVGYPKIKFNIDATKEGEGSQTIYYTFNFDMTLERATWYKINTTIKGFENTSDITITK